VEGFVTRLCWGEPQRLRSHFVDQADYRVGPQLVRTIKMVSQVRLSQGHEGVVQTPEVGICFGKFLEVEFPGHTEKNLAEPLFVVRYLPDELDSDPAVRGCLADGFQRCNIETLTGHLERGNGQYSRPLEPATIS